MRNLSKNVFYLILTTALFFSFSCSKKESPQFLAEYDSYNRAAGLDYNDTGVAGIAYSESSSRAAETSYIKEEPRDTVSSDLTNPNSVERKLVKRAYIRIRVENLEAADAFVSSLMRKYNAYAASTEIEENSRFYSLRVPAPQYDAFLGETDGMGRILRRSETTEDVTLAYYDLEGRLATKNELLRTYQSYLRRANNIEEILSVEARIADLQNDIDWTGTRLRNLANQVDYTTIDLSLLGPASLTANQKETFGEQIKVLFSGFGSFLSTVIIVITSIVIYGIPILMLLIFFYWILLGRIGLLKKLWRVITSQKQSN